MELCDIGEPPPSKKMKIITEAAQSTSKSFSDDQNVIKNACKKLKCKDYVAQMAALMKLRRLLSNKDGTLVEILIENGCVPILIDFLSAKNSDVRFNAACIISYISSGTPEQMEFIVQAKVLPALKELLISTNHDICNQVLLALGNIILAGFHDECFQLGIIEEIIKIDCPTSDLAFTLTTVILHICQKCPLPLNAVYQIMPKIVKLLNDDNLAIRKNCLMMLEHITRKGPNEVKAVIDGNFFPLLLPLITNSNNQTQIIAIWIFRNIIEYVEIDAGVVNTISTIAGLLGVESEDPLQHNEISMAILCAIGTFFSRGENACRCLLEKHMGILEVLTKLLKADTTDLLQILMPLVENLCYNYGFNILPESATEFLRSILPVIKNENIDVVILALRSLSAFTESQIKNLSMPRWINERYANLLNYHDNAKLSEAIFYGFGTIFNICYPKMKDIVAKNTVKKMDLFLTHCDHAIQEKALCFLSKAADDKQKICYIVSAELLPHIIKILDCQNYVLQTKAADLIKKIAGGTNDETKAVVAAHAIAPLIYLLNSECLDVQVASLGALANITGCTPTERDNCVKLNIVDSLINLWSKQKSPTLLQHFAWILDNIFRDPLPPADVIRKLLPSLLKLIEGFVTPNPDLLNVLVDSLSALVNITRKISEANEYIIDKGIVPLLVSFLKYPNDKVNISTLLILRNIATIKSKNKRNGIPCDLLKNLTSLLLLNNENNEICMNSLELLNSVANGNEFGVQDFIHEKQFIPVVIYLLKTKDFSIKQEAAHFLSKLIIKGTSQELREFLKTGFLKYYLQFMKKCDISLVGLFLKSILNLCEKLENNVMETRLIFFASGGYTVLSHLFNYGKQKQNNEICLIIYGCIKALKIRLSEIPNNDMRAII